MLPICDFQQSVRWQGAAARAILTDSMHEKKHTSAQTILHLLHHHSHHPRRHHRFQDDRGQQDKLARRPVHDCNHHHDCRIRRRDRTRRQADGKALHHSVRAVFNRHDPVCFYEPCRLHYRGGAEKGFQAKDDGEEDRKDEGSLRRLRHRHGGALHQCMNSIRASISR